MKSRIFAFLTALGALAIALEALAGAQQAPRIAWQADIGFRDVAFLVRSEGLVLAGNPTDDGYLVALDEKSGRIVWKIVVGQMVQGVQPALGDGVLYGYAAHTTSQPAGVFAVAVRTGKVLWRVPRIPDMLSAMTAANGKLYYTTPSGGIAALDGATGKQLWKHTTFPASPTTQKFYWCATRPVVSSGTAYFTPGYGIDRGSPSESRGLVVAVDAATGAEKWRASPDSAAADKSPSPACYTVAIAGDALMVNSRTILRAVDPATGTERWKSDLTSQPADSYNPWGVVQYSDGKVLALKSTMRAYDVTSGALLWDIARESNHVANANGALYFNWREDAKTPKRQGFGWIYAMDLATQRVLWKMEIDDGLAKYSLPYWGVAGLLPVDGGLVYNIPGKIVRVNTPPRV